MPCFRTWCYCNAGAAAAGHVQRDASINIDKLERDLLTRLTSGFKGIPYHPLLQSYL
jgi:hypothetical protein